MHLFLSFSLMIPNGSILKQKWLADGRASSAGLPKAFGHCVVGISHCPQVSTWRKSIGTLCRVPHFLGWLGSVLLPRNWGPVLILTLPKMCLNSLPLGFTPLEHSVAALWCWTWKFRRNLEQTSDFLW